MAKNATKRASENTNTRNELVQTNMVGAAVRQPNKSNASVA
ncbi:hypothetical protein [Enterococcus gallinarum]|nr:hypothetical protein RV03_GL003269 [Enterococcus gallinarum]